MAGATERMSGGDPTVAPRWRRRAGGSARFCCGPLWPPRSAWSCARSRTASASSARSSRVSIGAAWSLATSSSCPCSCSKTVRLAIVHTVGGRVQADVGRNLGGWHEPGHRGHLRLGDARRHRRPARLSSIGSWRCWFPRRRDFPDGIFLGAPGRVRGVAVPVRDRRGRARRFRRRPALAGVRPEASLTRGNRQRAGANER